MFHKTILESVGISELRLPRLVHVVNSLDVVNNHQGHPQHGSHFICCTVVKYPDESSLGAKGVISVHTYRVRVHRSVDVPEAGLGTATFFHPWWSAERSGNRDAYDQLTVSFSTLGI